MLKGPKRSFGVIYVWCSASCWRSKNVKKITKNVTKRTKNVREGNLNRKSSKEIKLDIRYLSNFLKTRLKKFSPRPRGKSVTGKI